MPVYHAICQPIEDENKRKMIRTDGVKAATRAGVTGSRAAESGRGLGGSVVDGVAGCSTAALERVEQTDPVADFVSESLTEIW